jgi:hypothetical protein
MEYFEIEGRRYEVTIVSEAEGDEISVECFDMTLDGGGLVGIIGIRSDGRGQLTLYQPVGTPALRRWMSIAERDAGLR